MAVLEHSPADTYFGKPPALTQISQRGIMAAEKTATVEVKFVRSANYKGVEFKSGLTVKVEPHVAQRLIGDGTAVVVEAKEKKAEK